MTHQQTSTITMPIPEMMPSLPTTPQLNLVTMMKTMMRMCASYRAVMTKPTPNPTTIMATTTTKRRREHHRRSGKPGLIAELVQETVAITKRNLGGRVKSNDDESIARKYHSVVIDGRLCSAVRELTNRGGEGVTGIKTQTPRPERG